jgi:hypothetical protein
MTASASRTRAFSGSNFATDSDKKDFVPPDVEEESEEPDPPPPPPPLPAPAGQGKVAVMDGERVVFTEETNQQNYVKLIASGAVDDTLLEALEDYVKRQRKRLRKDEAVN